MAKLNKKTENIEIKLSHANEIFRTNGARTHDLSGYIRPDPVFKVEAVNGTGIQLAISWLSISLPKIATKMIQLATVSYLKLYIC